MKISHFAIIVIIMVAVVSSFNIALAQNATNSSNVIPPIPTSILNSPVPTLTPSENQSVVKVALSIPELQNWSHDWKYVGMGFLGNNKLGIAGGFEWQYAIVNLKAPSSSAPIPCYNDWWAWIEIDMTTMKIVQATYPTMESHQCEVAMGGGPGTSRVIVPVAESPLKQFKSGITAKDVKCKQDFLLMYKSEDSHPYCTTPPTALHLLEIGWGQIASPFDTNTDLLNSKISGGIITGYHYDFQSKSLVIKTQTATNGTLTVTIPRKLLDAKTDGQDDHFYVLMNGQEIDFTETMTTDVGRTLLIPFTNGTQEIEIIGAQVI